MIYLIDFENVGNRWADLIGTAGPGDTAVLFYTDNSPKAMLDQLEKAERMGLALKFRRCEAGPNGLDFQLSSELGYLAGTGAGKEFRILSNDSGYDVLEAYWLQAGIAVSRDGEPAGQADAPPAHERAGEPPGGTGPVPDPKHSVSAWLDGPMTQMRLRQHERAHVLGCARACVTECHGEEAMMERFRSDTERIKGRSFCRSVMDGLGPALSGLFRSAAENIQ